jgi:NAD(P)-dependent dehydrogenase (short-subunit alcohol dehydrogenase family)
MSSPNQRANALLAQLLPTTHAPPASRFPGCASVLEVAPCAAAAATAAGHSPLIEGARLAGRVALITGAGSGIGRATALLFATQGASLFLVDLALEDSLNETLRVIAEAVPAAASRVALHVADVTAEDAATRMVDACVARFGTLHVFFANAGVLGSVGGLEISARSFSRTLAVNVVAVFTGFKAAAAHMLSKGPEHRGALLCTASVAGLRSGAGGVDYSASKAALINLVQTMANELGGTNIRVNAICPYVHAACTCAPRKMRGRCPI